MYLVTFFIANHIVIVVVGKHMGMFFLSMMHSVLKDSSASFSGVSFHILEAATTGFDLA